MTNLILLFSAVLLLLIANYILNGREIFSAGCISAAVFALSSGYAMLFFEHYGTDISDKTVAVAVCSIAAIGAGELLARAAVRKREKFSQLEGTVENFSYIEIKKTYIIFIFILTVTLGILRYYYLYLVSLQYGNQHQILKAVAYTRDLLISGRLEGHRFLSYGCTFCMSASYAAVFIFFYNLLVCRHRDFLLLLPAAAYLLIPLASTGRVEYIQYLTVIFSVFVMCYRQSKGWKVKGNPKIFFAGTGIFAVFLAMFRYIGSMRDKWGGTSDIFTDLSAYLSAGIYGFDRFLNQGADSGHIFGYESFAWLYAVINRFFGTDIPVASFQPFYTVGNIRSNIYTGLKPFAQDFSVAGLLSICFFLGVFYSLWLERIRAAGDLRRSFLSVMGFSIFIYPMVMLSVAGTFRAILTTGYVLVFIFLGLLNRFVINPAKSREN